ncbi:MAG: ferritin-like domain-containing protein [bacterium]
MSIFFSGSELIDIAVQIEKNGAAFYTSVTRLSREGDLKKFFDFLADQERQHIKIFQGIGESLGDYKVPADQEEYYLYMKALADSRVFTSEFDARKVAGEMKGEEEAIRFALGFEKDSLLFFYEMRNIVRPSDQKVVDELILQEREHIRLLSDIEKRGIKNISEVWRPRAS